MEKTFTKIEVAIIKRTAQNVAQYVNKKEKLNAEIEKIKASKQELIDKYAASLDDKLAGKVAKIQAEIAVFQPIIDSFQAPIKEMTGGYTTEDLVTREVVHTGKIDTTTGKELLQTRFVLKYPDTVVPPVADAPFEAEDNSAVPADETTWTPEEKECPSYEEEAPLTEEMAMEEMAAMQNEDPFVGNTDWD